MLLILSFIVLVVSVTSKLVVSPYTAQVANFGVNSVLIEGDNDIIVVDSQFVISEAAKVSQYILQTGKNLRAIWISHPHPDHYFGIGTLLTNFPSASVFAIPDVVDDIQANAQAAIDKWKKNWGNASDIPDTFVLPTAYTQPTFSLDGEEIQIAIYDYAGESAHDAGLFIPSLGALVGGDLTYSNTHLWLVEREAKGWIANLKGVQTNYDLSIIYPGHGPVGNNTGNLLIKENLKYIADFVNAVSSSVNATYAFNSITESYPSYQLPVILQLSLASWFANLQ
eukprot:TRINITY_DN25353_c0_g1_i1.p1 TRINITY_DN25353_c0_g1~~TRINITY_DN25353_c0_g1_i1.p1  ORF type:complete len:282 (+),score=35.63 TRINITY_DN25353_c0_g1_i1:104-949(+)